MHIFVIQLETGIIDIC